MRLQLRPTPLTDSLLSGPEEAFTATEMIEHARKMERERDYLIRSNNTLRLDMDGLAHEICQLQDALGCSCEVPDAQEKAMERLRDLIAMEGELGDLKEFIREEIVCEVYNQYGQNNALIATLKSKCAADEKADESPDGQEENVEVRDRRAVPELATRRSRRFLSTYLFYPLLTTQNL